MATIYVVRHGKAAAGIGDHLDPGLDALGRRQAADTAARLNDKGPLPILSSPFARARETAEPLAQRWQQRVVIEPRVAEIPYPMEDLAERSRWLQGAMAGRWSDLSTDLQSWRGEVVSCIAEQPTDCVVFCHFVAINVVVGAAQDDDRLVIFPPDNGSVTTLSNEGGTLSVLDLGHCNDTHIN